MSRKAWERFGENAIATQTRVRKLPAGYQAINGSSVLALGLGSTVLAHARDITRAVDYGERALKLSPRDPTIYLPLTALGIVHNAAGNFEAAVAVCGKAMQANPRFSFPCALQTAALPAWPDERGQGRGAPRPRAGAGLQHRPFCQVPHGPPGHLGTDRRGAAPGSGCRSDARSWGAHPRTGAEGGAAGEGCSVNSWFGRA